MSDRHPERIYLTGMPGSGKTSVGRELARMLGYEFVDLDAEVEQRTGQTPTALFRAGEAAFRAAEKEALLSTTHRYRVVVATGGGALIDSDSRNVARGAGAVVYLRVPVAVLVARLAGTTDRPLLTGEGGHPLSRRELGRRLGLLLADRTPAYGQAHHVIRTARRDPAALAVEIATLTAR